MFIAWTTENIFVLLYH